MEIVDPRTGKRYEAKDFYVISHEIIKENGEVENTKCVEFTVIGKNRTWRNWAIYDEFVKFNPDIKI